jgi:hypothetical protein
VSGRELSVAANNAVLAALSGDALIFSTELLKPKPQAKGKADAHPFVG